MSERLGPPPVEPMSDLSWARIERGLWARLDGTGPTTVVQATPRRWRWLAVPAFAAAAGATLYLGMRGDAPPTAPVVAPAIAEPTPTRVTTGAAPSTLSFGDAHVTLDADSAVVMTQAATASTAMLERGAAWFAVAERTQPFVVVAGDTVVRVVGTRFRVARFEERATVEVERGLVDVTFQGITVQLGAGQRWTSLRPATVEPIAPSTPAPRAVPSADAPVDDRAPNGGDDGDDAGADRAAPGDAAPAPAPTARTARKADAKTAAVAPTPAVDRDRATYERLSAAEARDPEGALAGYLALARGTGPWAEVALFAAGRLAADRGDARAPNLLSIYLRRFPRGANTDDARKLIDRLKGAP